MNSRKSPTTLSQDEKNTDVTSGENRLGHELHVALQQVELRQRHRHHLVAGTLDDQVSPLEEVQGELEVQVGAEAPQNQMAAHFADEGGIGLAIQRDVAEDVLAAVDPVLDVGVQVAVDVFIVWKVIQGQLDKWQLADDFLQSNRTHHVTPLRFLFHVSCTSNQIPEFSFKEDFHGLQGLIVLS